MNQPTPTLAQFEPGQTYATRSIGDSNCIIRFTVTNRTAKTVQGHVEGEPGLKTFRPYVYSGVEQVRPWGRYSMCPVLGADDTRELKRDWEQVAA